jgi:hypothetical protein
MRSASQARRFFAVRLGLGQDAAKFVGDRRRLLKNGRQIVLVDFVDDRPAVDSVPVGKDNDARRDPLRWR